MDLNLNSDVTLNEYSRRIQAQVQVQVYGHVHRAPASVMIRFLTPVAATEASI